MHSPVKKKGVGILLYSAKDKKRVFGVKAREGTSDYRSEFRRDYARLIHSPSFRRLQGKTQLFPGDESDFFRNRLTHSLEVAQIAKTIAIKLNEEVPQLKKTGKDQQIDCDLVELAALAHDLGHPPFGHNGEKALDDCMKAYGGFEGNAQTLRILSKLEKKQEENKKIEPVDKKGNDGRIGLNLTYRSLAAVLKYDSLIKLRRKRTDGVSKGYYQLERELVATIKQHVAPECKPDEFKTIECCIMDAADDIAYSTYDLEDALKGGFISPLRLLSILAENRPLLKRIKDKANRTLKEKPIEKPINEDKVVEIIWEEFKSVLKNGTLKGEIESTRILRAYTTSDELSKNGYSRRDFSGGLVNKFIQGIRIDFDDQCPALSKVCLDPKTRTIVEVLKHLTYEVIIMSPRLKIVEHRGYEVVKTIFDTLNSDDGHLLLPDDCRTLYEQFAGTDDKVRVICDFVAGMTDQYALEFYNRIKGTGESIFKPF